MGTHYPEGVILDRKQVSQQPIANPRHPTDRRASSNKEDEMVGGGNHHEEYERRIKHVASHAEAPAPRRRQTPENSTFGRPCLSRWLVRCKRQRHNGQSDEQRVSEGQARHRGPLFAETCSKSIRSLSRRRRGRCQ